MKIKRIALIMAVIMAFGGVSSFAKTLEFTIGSENLYVSENTVEKKVLDAVPYTENWRTMVPVRAVSENFGAEVSWNDLEQKVTIVSGDITVELIINSDIAKVNGEEKKLDTPAITVNGRTMVPLRFVGEALNKSVEYIELTEQILISDDTVAQVGNELVNFDDYKVCALIYNAPFTQEATAYLVPQISSIIGEQYALANDARNNGFVLSDDTKGMIINELTSQETKDYIYSSSLLASAVKYYTNYFLGIEYLNSLVGIPDPAEIEEIYIKDYVRAKHILILSEDDKEKAKKTITDIKKRLDKGEDFDKLMEELSEDPGSKEIPQGYVFTYGEMVPEFEKAAFALKEGEISDMVETAYGYHIIKREPLPQVDIEKFLANEPVEGDYNAIYSIVNKFVQESTNENLLRILQNTQFDEILGEEEIIKALLGE